MSNSKKMITQIGKIVGKSINTYYPNKLKSKVDEVKFKESYQGRIIDCMVGEVDDNYIETPETDSSVVKLEHSREGLVKVPTIKGKTILIDPDGNETDTPGEGCRLVSVGESEDNKLIILSKNKNFKPAWINGGINSNDGSDNNSDRNIKTDFIPIKIENIYISGLYNQVSSYVAFYDKDKKYLKRTGGNTRTVLNLRAVDNPSIGNDDTIPLNCKYIRLTQYLVSGQTATMDEVKANTKNVQIEYDNYSTYAEPKYHKTEILLNESLRRLPNGVCDEIIGNQLIRRVGIFSSKKYNPTFVKKATRSMIQFSNINNMKIINESISNDLMCNNFKSVAHYFYMGEHGEGVHNKNTTIFFNVENSKFETLDTKGMSKWLEDRELIVLYELEEPIVEELPNSITLQGYDDTTMYIENSITPTVSYGYNALIPYKEELSNQKEEVETNTLDIENNIIPYLMDMEFNIMLMEGDINGTEG